MCGRFTLTRPDEVAKFFELSEQPGLEVRHNIAPAQDVLAIPGRPGVPRLMKWGLVSSRTAGRGSPLINARAETIDRKVSFRESFRIRRCVLPADGFYEWSREGGRKQPFYFHLKNGGLFAFAGLWEASTDETGKALETCTIVTTSPNQLVARIHDRMPVILEREAVDLWLDGEAPPHLLKELLGPLPADRMAMVAVNPALNRVDFEGPDCLLPPPRRPRNLKLF